MTRGKIIIAVLGILLLGSMFGCAVGIHDAIKKGNPDAVKSLLAEKPESVSDKDKYGYTPLHIAAANGHKEIADLLRRNGGK